ncbi:hypothetical protein [Methylobacterium durans]|uniref:Uncharacterized protein n=1 Tax=Methylobacterium durans TaxID=2202825 RepID=A0A2U8W447_9HYPH|nr:hypothetical protein [Methylobacterium durans]AWN40290.1 hypothetical protein DK389_06750 [Methylobacterium durans]
MAVPLALPVAQAAAFTLGCALIHALRRHHEPVTGVLAGVALILVLALMVASLPADVPIEGCKAELGVSLAAVAQ